MHHAKPAGRRAGAVGTDDQGKRTGAWRRAGLGARAAEPLRQPQDSDVGAGVAAGEACLHLGAVADDGEVGAFGKHLFRRHHHIIAP